jgi:hypothetical protein
MPAGRPNEGRVRLNIHVLPETAEAITELVDKKNLNRNTQGKVVDSFVAETRSRQMKKGDQSSS